MFQGGIRPHIDTGKRSIQKLKGSISLDYDDYDEDDEEDEEDEDDHDHDDDDDDDDDDDFWYMFETLKETLMTVWLIVPWGRGF